ncbi:MAG: PqiC family protein [Burkholderiaceae bacterium]
MTGARRSRVGSIRRSTMPSRAGFAAGAALTLALAGCGSTPTTTFYTLVPPADASLARAAATPEQTPEPTRTSTLAPMPMPMPEQTPTPTPTLAQGKPLSLSISTVSVPEIVDRPQFVVRDGPNEQRLYEHRRWSQALPREIDGALRAHLARRLPGARIATAGQDAAADASWRLALDVQRFEATRGQDTVFEALWTLRDRSGAAVDSGRFVDRRAVSDPSFDALAASQAASIERLAQVLAERITADARR